MTDTTSDTNSNATSRELRIITPDLPKQVLGKLSAFIEVKRSQGRETLIASLRRLNGLWQNDAWSLELRTVALVLADLIDQGWDVSADDNAIHLQPPGLRLLGESVEEAKGRLRRALQVNRDRQLTEPGVRRFVERMHRIVPRTIGKSSIADVIDNGAELAELLEPISRLTPEHAAARLKSVIEPVIEVCDEGEKCSTTGLRLIDIWRYFRHTWSLEYRPTPGRQLTLLVRNSARPKRPVIGIAMLASPVVRMKVRDEWIGWNADPFIAKLKSGEWDTEIALRALVARLEKHIAEIRSDDLVNPDELAFPSERTIMRLEQRNAGAHFARRRELESAYSQAEAANEEIRSQREKYLKNVDWCVASEDLLFVRKRAETLARLLDAKRVFQSLDWSQRGRDLLDKIFQHPKGERALNIAMIEIRKAGLSSQVADLSVCGAVAPYSDLLGGKLIALLMSSKEVRDTYRERYATKVSIISSQMAGRPIYRPAELKVLTTTSLYGNGSSQYNRLKLSALDYPELEHDVKWQELAQTAGFGTVHLGTDTVRLLRELTDRSHRARRVNNRFGEGASPRLRQIREALDMLGIESSLVLNHATPRVFYGCELHPGAREELLGFYPFTENHGPPVRVIANLWRQRWLTKRVRNAEVLSRVAAANAATQAAFFNNFRDRETFNCADEHQAELLQVTQLDPDPIMELRA